MLSSVHQRLLAWFDASGRELPWRRGPEGKRDPYRAWVAEILLQQTQVSRGLLYYQRFLDAFPTVQALAKAQQSEVLKAWEGCGYYARARNLHKAAGLVTQQGFPNTYQEWLALPGVGPYTAAALASLTLNEARAVNDGNVRRVLARWFAVQEPSSTWVQEKADELLHPQRPGAWNEALMDLGALICTPKQPQCSRCPVMEQCQAFQLGQPSAYPAPKARTAAQTVNAVAVIIGDAQSVVLEERQGQLLGGLKGLPSEEVRSGESSAQALARLCQRLSATAGAYLGSVQHTMTHRQITWEVYRASNELERETVAQAALSRLDHKALALLDGLFGESQPGGG